MPVWTCGSFYSRVSLSRCRFGRCSFYSRFFYQGRIQRDQLFPGGPNHVDGDGKRSMVGNGRSGMVKKTLSLLLVCWMM